MEIVKVTARPNRLPWVEGSDYEVLEGDPQEGDFVRIRERVRERFEIVQPPLPEPEPAAQPSQPTLAEIKQKLDEIATMVNAL